VKPFILAALVVILGAAAPVARSQPTIAISGATLIDGTGGQPVTNSVIIIQGDTIAAVGTVASIIVPPDVRNIDARGKFILPGLIDTHVHLEMVGLSDIGEQPDEWQAPSKLRDLVAINAKLDFIGGFTTVRDLGSTATTLMVRDAINSGQIVGPRIFGAGMQLVKKSDDANEEAMFLEYDGADSARAKVRFLASIGANVIKIRLTRMRPIPSSIELLAIVQEAHRLGLRATVHTDVPADDLVKLAIDAGADGIEHNAPLHCQDQSMLTLMGQKKMSLMPGAGAFYVQRIDSSGLIDAFDVAQQHVLPPDLLLALHSGIDTLHRQTERMKKAGWSAPQRQSRFIEDTERARRSGVLLVFGTDCGAYGMVHGEQYKALYGESLSGSSAMDAILMATKDAALALGKEKELGSIETGKLADLIIVNEDPLMDLRNLRHIFRVIKGGVVYDPAELISGSRR
jgi:imidazolonepropionase-like amidohydrolase